MKKRFRSFSLRFVWLAFVVFGLLLTSSSFGFDHNPLSAAPPPPLEVDQEGMTGAQSVHSVRSISDPIPREGDQKLLIVLVDFPDRPGLFSGQVWQNFFFGAAGFSDYFEEVSYDQLRYSGDVVGLSAGIPVINSTNVAYVRLPNPITYYANGQYGFLVGSGVFPQNHGGVVYHGLQALDAAGFDFSPYVDSQTNRAENLLVIFAGSSYGYVQDPNNSLEATAYNLTYAGLSSPYTSSGGQIFDNYTFCPEQRGNNVGIMANIGICVHEHGHALGMFDLYDLSYQTSGAGYYGLMSYGTYGSTDGQRPYQLSVFTKDYFNWITPTIVTAGTMQITLEPSEIDGTNFVKLYPDGNLNSAEYFLLENRQPIGYDQDWTNLGLCPGLLIWHVDETIVQAYALADLVNTQGIPGSPPHQGVIVVEADDGFDMLDPSTYPVLNFGECADTWGVGRTWNDSSTPNANLWDGSPSNLSVTVLSEAANSVTLSIRVGSGVTTPSTIYLPMVRK